MLSVMPRTRPMRSARRPNAMPPAALAISATDDSTPIVALVRPNSFWICTTAYVKRRKSIASSIQPSCAAKSARHARRSTFESEDMRARLCAAQTRKQKRLQADVGRDPARLALDLEIGDGGQG